MPASVPTRFPKTIQLIREGINNNLHLGMQVYVSKDAVALCDIALGFNQPQQPLETDTLMLWLSSGKPITAVSVMQFVERGKLELDQPVCDFVPEFAQSGKEGITVRHLLTHTVGIRPIVSGWPHQSWTEIIDKICQAPLQKDWVPGETAGYDPARSWFILAEVLRRIDGRSIDRIVREQILEPLGMMDCWMAIPSQIYRAYDDRIGITYSLKDHQLSPTRGHEKEVCAQPSPGGSMRGPANQLGLFYEMLLNSGRGRNGVQILKEGSVQQMTSRQRVGIEDRTFQHIVDFGLGLIINSNQYGIETIPYGFGRYAGDSAFGHGGAQSSIGFADPKHHLVVVAIANGCPGEEIHNHRFRELNSAIYEDLGLISNA